MEEALCERSVHSVLVVQESRELRISRVVDQQKLPLSQFHYGAGGG